MVYLLDINTLTLNLGFKLFPVCSKQPFVIWVEHKIA